MLLGMCMSSSQSNMTSIAHYIKHTQLTNMIHMCQAEYHCRYSLVCIPQLQMDQMPAQQLLLVLTHTHLMCISYSPSYISYTTVLLDVDRTHQHMLSICLSQCLYIVDILDHYILYIRHSLTRRHRNRMCMFCLNKIYIWLGIASICYDCLVMNPIGIIYKYLECWHCT